MTCVISVRPPSSPSSPGSSPSQPAAHRAELQKRIAVAVQSRRTHLVNSPITRRPVAAVKSLILSSRLSGSPLPLVTRRDSGIQDGIVGLVWKLVDKDGACRRLLRPWESPPPIEAIGSLVI